MPMPRVPIPPQPGDLRPQAETIIQRLHAMSYVEHKELMSDVWKLVGITQELLRR